MAKHLVGHHLLRVRIRKKIFEDLQEISEEASLRTNEHVTVSDLVRSACYNYILLHDSLRNLEATILNTLQPVSNDSLDSDYSDASDASDYSGHHEHSDHSNNHPHSSVPLPMNVGIDDINFDDMDEESAQEFIENASIHGEEYAVQKYALDQQYNVRENEEALISVLADVHELQSTDNDAFDDAFDGHNANSENNDEDGILYLIMQYAQQQYENSIEEPTKVKTKEKTRNKHKPGKNKKSSMDKAMKDLLVKFA